MLELKLRHFSVVSPVVGGGNWQFLMSGFTG
jgi:hypothetical protein